MQRLADLLAQRQDRVSLPRPEPEVFCGNPLHFPNWIKSFEIFITRKTKDPSESLYYLGKYTKNEVKEAVSGPLSLYSVDAYDKTTRILTSRFGNHFMAANAFRKKKNKWLAQGSAKRWPWTKKFFRFSWPLWNSNDYHSLLESPQRSRQEPEHD